jgi:hypothetical protein
MLHIARATEHQYLVSEKQIVDVLTHLLICPKWLTESYKPAIEQIVLLVA